MRIITDVLAGPAIVYPTLTATTGKPLDLTYSSARGVSPIHLEYLSNMAVRASMSIAIVVDGQLWGLIACHHYSPRFVDFYLRSTLLFLGKIIASQLSLREAYDFRQSVLRVNMIKSQLFGQMTEKWDIREGLTQGNITLLDMNKCGGAALYSENVLHTLGKTPKDKQILDLIAWLVKSDRPDFFHTDELAALYEPARACKDTAAGLLAVKIAKNANDYVLWFRPEVKQSLQWGGDPSKALQRPENGVRLSPRKSFEKWNLLVENKSLPWEQHEIEAAFSLANDIREFIVRKFAEIASAHRELEEAYTEMESFSYTISHDLRTPLRSIEGFANILKEDYAAGLDQYGQSLIDTILHSTKRMDSFIQDILVMSRLGRKSLQLQMTPLKELVTELVHQLQIAAKVQGRRVKVIMAGELPDVYADRMVLEQILSNLLSNAFKYTRLEPKPVVEIGGGKDETHFYFYVKDNGIGFDSAFNDRIFGIFNRLVLEEEFEGTGIGLAIVKRAVEKHHGEIKTESRPGEGATFTIRLPMHLNPR